MPNLQITNTQNNTFSGTSMTVPVFCSAKTEPIPQDTVEISDKKKKDNNLALKLILGSLGIAGAIFAYIKLHKTSPVKNAEELSSQLKEVQQIYKDIFRRDIDAAQTKDFAQRYKKIIDSKTPDNDREYCEKLLDELCKDRQTKRPIIHNWIEKKADAAPECINGGMSTAADGTYIDVYLFSYHNNSKMPVPERNLFTSLFHETHHVKQDEIIYRTDKEFFLEHLINKFILDGEGTMYKEMLRANGGDKAKTFNKVKELLQQRINFYWGDLTPFERNSAEYQEGLRLIEGKKNYKFMGDCTGDEYANQIIEKGAYADGKKAEKLFDLLKQITI